MWSIQEERAFKSSHYIQDLLSGIIMPKVINDENNPIMERRIKIELVSISNKKKYLLTDQLF